MTAPAEGDLPAPAPPPAAPAGLPAAPELAGEPGQLVLHDGETIDRRAGALAVAASGKMPQDMFKLG